MKPNAGAAQAQRNIFSKNLRFYMALAGKNQIDLSRDLGVTTSTVSDWFNGKKYPRVDTMQAIADYLGVVLSDLREGEPPTDIRLGQEATEKLPGLLAMVDQLTDDEWKKLLDYADLLISSRKNRTSE